MTNIIGSYPLSSFHESFETKGSLISNFILSFTRLHTPPPPSTMHSFQQNKIFSLSFIRMLPLFHSIFYFHGNKTFISSSLSQFYLSDSFTILLQTRKNVSKLWISVHGLHMCNLIRVQVVGYRHIRMLSLSVTLLKWSSFWILEQMQHFFPTKFWKILLKICWTYNCILESIF